MQIQIPKIKNCLDFGLFIFTIKTGLDMSGIIQTNEYLDAVLIVTGLAMFMIAILQQGYTPKTLIKYAIITVVSLYSTILSGQSVIIVTVITILAIRQADITKVVRKNRIWASYFLLIHTLYYAVLLLMGKVRLFSVDAQGRTRASFGFGHANTFSVYLFNLILAWTWEKYDNLTKKQLAIIAIIETASFAFTNSKTSYICALIFLAILFFKKKGNIIHRVAGLIVPVTATLFLLAYRLWIKGNLIVYAMDSILTGRIKLGAYALYNYGITAFGQKMSYGTLVWDSRWNMNYFTLDCTYTSLWTNIGWIWLLILSVAFFMLSRKCNMKVSVFIIMWAMYAISEVHGLDAYLCFPILLVVLLLQPQSDLSVTKMREIGYGSAK